MKLKIPGNPYLMLPFLLFVIYMFSANFIFESLIKIRGESSLIDLPMPKTAGPLKYGFDVVAVKKIAWKNMIAINGWGFVPGHDSRQGHAYIVLATKERTYIYDTTRQHRRDVSRHFGVEYEYDMSGFNALVNAYSIKNGVFELGLCIQHGGEWFCSKRDEKYTKNDQGTFRGMVSSPVDITLPASPGIGMKKEIDEIAQINEGKSKLVRIKGWAFADNCAVAKQKTYITLISDRQEYVYDTAVQKRPDVTRHFRSSTNLDDCGFESVIPFEEIDEGNYKVGVYLQACGKEYVEFLHEQFVR